MSEPAKVLSVRCISHVPLSLTLVSAVTRAEDHANVCALRSQGGQGRAQIKTNTPQYHFHIYTCARGNGEGGGGGPLLCKCTGRVCGEVQTLLAHPVWDSLSCVFCPKLLNTHMQRHTQQTCARRLIMPYVRHDGEVRRERAQKTRTGAHLFGWVETPSQAGGLTW